MKLGFIGIGLMGRPMTLRLLAAGHEVAVWNRSRDKLGAVVEPLDPTRAASLTDRIMATPELMDIVGPAVGLLRRTHSEARV